MFCGLCLLLQEILKQHIYDLTLTSSIIKLTTTNYYRCFKNTAPASQLFNRSFKNKSVLQYSESAMESYQKHPLKIYIQDIFRAKQSGENKYIYNIFDLTFKNIMIHGVVTSTYNTTPLTTNLELSDPTGCIQVYYDVRKNNMNISSDTLKDLIQSFANFSRSGDDKALPMSDLLNSIEKRHKNPMAFQEGSHISVVGDIFFDDLKNTRMISAYQIRCTSVERDIIWLEELRYMYDKFYLKQKS